MLYKELSSLYYKQNPPPHGSQTFSFLSYIVFNFLTPQLTIS